MSTSTKNAHLAITMKSDPRWAAVVARDPQATFFYSVKTTGVYCRPSCAARLARPEHVQFQRTCKDAENAGFRPWRKSLNKSNTVTDAIYDAGYNSNSRFYETSNQVLGMTPSNYRAGGAQTDIRFVVGECSLGSILVAQSELGICAIFLGDDPDALVRELQDQFPNANLIGGDAGFEQLVAKVVGFVEAPERGLDVPLDIRGTAFQQRVWQSLRKIPAGSTANYTDVAKPIGSPRSVRAVAQACGAHKLAVVIPCHRVVRNDGALSGYRWGVERKRALLKKEANA